MTKITITVEGPSGSGKSAIVQVIALALAERHITTLPDSRNTEKPTIRDPIELSTVLKNIGGTSEVYILEVRNRK